MSNELTTELAIYAHEAWSGWMKHMFNKSRNNQSGTITIPKELVKRWKRQMNTSYENLPANEQLSDIDESHKMIAIFDKFFKERGL